MTEQPENYEPTEVDIDIMVEEVAGKPVQPENLATGIAAIRRRIAQFEAEKTKLLGHMGEDLDGMLKSHLVAVNKDLAKARNRLAHYEAQLGKQN